MIPSSDLDLIINRTLELSGNSRDLIDLAKASEKLGHSVKTLKRWIKKGKLKGYQPARKIMVRVADVNKLLNESEI